LIVLGGGVGKGLDCLDYHYLTILIDGGCVGDGGFRVVAFCGSGGGCWVYHCYFEPDNLDVLLLYCHLFGDGSCQVNGSNNIKFVMIGSTFAHARVIPTIEITIFENLQLG
jgi:hypothetical protein